MTPLLAAAALAVAVTTVSDTVATVRFARDVRPILSDKCFKCHGPDAAQRKKDLRLDVAESAGGKLAEIRRRIESSDPDERMPPSDSGLSLSPAEIERLSRWIGEGARYEPHWAFVPPERPPVPAPARAGWARNEIDAFVLARLESEGLAPSPEADRATLLRRAALDLTGLPPSPADLDAFLADAAPGSYERAVDRFLASPAFGERMCAPWLDAARYADTHGYQVDAVRSMWRWRDWVIDAFNRNLPYDRFVIEQIAGDLLPGATLEQRVATGFNRNHRINGEGGSIAEEFHVEYVADRAETTATVFLGLTMACARCHDHKYDPLPQRDYYRFFALFNNVPELGVDGRDDKDGNAPPAIPAPTAEEAGEMARLDREIARLEAEIDAPRPDLERAEAAYAAEAAAIAGEWLVFGPGATAVAEGGAKLLREEEGSFLASGPNPDTDAYTIVAPLPPGIVTGLRLEALPHDSLPNRGPGRPGNGNIVLTHVEIALGSSADMAGAAPLPIASATADYSQPRYPVEGAIDADPKSGWGLDPQTGRAHDATFVLGAPVSVPEPGGFLRVKLEFRSHAARHQLGRFRLATTGARDPHRLRAIPDAVLAALRVAPERRGVEARAAIRSHFRRAESALLAPQRERLAALRSERDAIGARVTSVMVMEEMPAPRETRVLERGVYDRPRETVSAGVPAFLPPLPPGAPANRLGLALWLTDARNPLAARVAVNRFFELFFGAGLLATPENFGSQADWPSHPELLDWLATEFVASGWDVKGLVRLLVTSAAYRQSSRVTPELVERDPANRLLARGPRFRLPSETIRDQALFASGLLSPRIGGPPVKPYQPPGLWEEMAYGPGVNIYQMDSGASLYRRSLYTLWRRTVPPPTVSTFDGPGREVCQVRRSRTNTPLQALALLNDVTYVEAARSLAERMMKEGGAAPESRLARGYRLVLARDPRADEAAIALAGLDRRLAAFRAEPASAQALLAAGAAPRDASLDPAEHAAWTTVASVIMNLDEAVTRE